MMEIVVWADGMWEYLAEYDAVNYSWMSDDFKILTVPEDAEEEQIELIVEQFIRGDFYA